jgi:hypothetical protein
MKYPPTTALTTSNIYYSSSNGKLYSSFRHQSSPEIWSSLRNNSPFTPTAAPPHQPNYANPHFGATEAARTSHTTAQQAALDDLRHETPAPFSTPFSAKATAQRLNS